MRKLIAERNITLDIIKNHKIECSLIGLMAIVGLFCFNYADGQSLMVYSVQIWDAIFSGRILDLPQFYLENARNAPHGGIAISGSILLIQLPWAIWNLPIWLVSTISNNMDISTMPCLIWAKCFLLLCALATGLQCYHIVLHLTQDEKKSKLAAIFFWGSSTLTISIHYSMQDEIIYLLMFMLAIRCYFEHKDVQSFIWTWLSFLFAPFMILIHLTFFLFTEKRVRIIVLRFTAMIVSYIVMMNIIPAITSTNDNYLEWFFGRAVLNMGIATVSIYCVCLIVLYAFSYFCSYNNRYEQDYMLLYLLAITASLMCVLSWLHFYRYVICVPFLIVAFFSKKSNNDTISYGAAMVFALFEGLRLLGATLFDNNFLNAANGLSTLMKRYVDESLSSVSDLLQRGFSISSNTIAEMRILIASLIFGALLILLWLMGTKRNNIIMPFKRYRVVAIAYTCIPLVFYVSYLICIPHFYALSTGINGNSPLADAITQSQSFEINYFSDVGNIKNLSINPVTWGRTYPDDLMLCLDIYDGGNDEIIAHREENANLLPNNAEYTFDLSDCKLKKSHPYTIKLYTSGTMTSEEDYIYLLRSEEDSIDGVELVSTLVNSQDSTSQALTYQVISSMSGWH